MEYSHDDPDQPIGYWAERWAEFKRLWLLSWREPDTKPTLYLAGAMFFGALIWGAVEKYF